MAKQLSLVVSIAVLIVLLALVGAYWVGAPLLRLAYFDERSDQPLTVLNFVSASSDAIYRGRYRLPFEQLLASQGGRLLDDYQLHQLLDGGVADEWQRMHRVSVPQGSDLVSVMTTGPYRLLQQGLGEIRQIKLVPAKEIQTPWRDGVIVLMLREQSERTDSVEQVLQRLLASGEGIAKVVVDSQVKSLNDDFGFNRLLIMDFDDRASTMAWLRSASVKTDRAVLNARVDSMALAVFTQ